MKSVKNIIKSVTNFVKFNGATNIADIKNGTYTAVSPNVIEERGDAIYSKVNYKTNEVNIKVINNRTKESKAHLCLTLIQENTFLENIGASCVPVKIGNSVKMMEDKDRYQDTIVKVNRDTKSLDTFKKTYTNVMYMDASKGIVCYQNKHTGEYVDLVNDVILDNVDGFKAYVFGYYTTGSVKMEGSFWILKETSISELIKTNIPHIHRAYLKLNKMSEVKARKVVSRLSLAITGNRKFFGVSNIAMVRGKLGDMIDPATGKIVNGADGTVDGKLLIPNDVLMEALRLGTVEEAMQFLSQLRVEDAFLAKGQGQAHSRDYNSEVLETLFHTGNLDIYGIKLEEGWSVTRESRKAVFDQVHLIVDSDVVKLGGDRDDMENYDIANEGIVVNVLKIKSKPTEANIAIQTLEKVYDQIAKVSKNKGIDNANDYFFNMFKEDIIKKIAKVFEPGTGVARLSTKYNQDIVKEITERLAPIPAYRAVLDLQNSAVKTIGKLALCPRHEDGSAASLTCVLDSDISALLINGGLLKEGEVFFGQYASDMKYISETFGEDSEEYKSFINTKGKAVLFRYPSLELKETVPVKFVSYADICERLNAKVSSGEITQECSDTLKYEFDNVSMATLMLCANSKLFRILSGGDIDMDSVNNVTDKLYVETLYGLGLREDYSMCLKPEEKRNKEEQAKFEESYNSLVNEVSTRINAKNKDNAIKIEGVKTYNSLSKDYYSDIYDLTIVHEGLVGIINIRNTQVISALTQLRLGNNAPALEILKALIGKEGKRVAKLNVKCFDKNGKKLYGEKYIAALFAEMETLKWTNSVMIDCLENFNIHSMVEMSSNIDGAKTGDYIEPAIKTDTIISDFLCPIKTTLVKGSKFYRIERIIPAKVGDKIKLKTTSGEKVDRTIILINTSLGELQNRMINFMNNEVSKLINNNSSLFNYSDKEIVSFIKVINRVKKLDDLDDSNILNSLYMMKSLYEEYSANYRFKRSEVDIKDDDAALRFKELKEEFFTEIEPIRKSSITIFNSLTFSENEASDMMIKGALALALSVYGYDFDTKQMEYVASSTNKFAYNVLPEFVYGYYTNGTGEYRAEGRIIQQGDAKVGQTVELINGINKDLRLFIAERFDGEVTVASNGKVFKNVSFIDEIKAVEESGAMIILDKKVLDKAITNQYNENNENKKSLELLTSISKETCIRVDEEGSLISVNNITDFIDCGEEYFFDGELDCDYAVASITEVFINVPAQLNRDTTVSISTERRYVYVLNLKEVK